MLYARRSIRAGIVGCVTHFAVLNVAEHTKRVKAVQHFYKKSELAKTSRYENSYIGRSKQKEVKMFVAAILFEKGVFSSGQAADFAGITKREFIETVDKYGISIFNEPASDLKENLDK